MKKKLLAQNLVEGILILALVALGCLGFVSHFNMKTLIGYVLNRPEGSVTIEKSNSKTTGNLSSTELSSIDNQIADINSSLSFFLHFCSGNGPYRVGMIGQRMVTINNAIKSMQSTLDNSPNSSETQKAALAALKSECDNLNQRIASLNYDLYNNPSATDGIRSSLTAFQTATKTVGTITSPNSSKTVDNTITIESMTK